MNGIKSLIDKNSRWADQISNEDPDFFQESSRGQNPDYLWIGCADSRVPPNTILDLPPGHLFVHRNIANVVVHSDLNSQSVLQYAVNVLKVKHVIICGHYNCGGVEAAFQSQGLGLIENWLQHIRGTIDGYQAMLQDIEESDKKFRLLCEINVRAQVLNAGNSPFVRDAWNSGQSLAIHGLIYELSTGKLKDLDFSAASPEELQTLHSSGIF